MSYFGGTFLRFIYVHITKYIDVRFWTFTEIMKRENVVFCGCMYCINLTCSVFRTLRRSVLQLIAKPSHAEASVLRKVLGIVREILIKLMLVVFLN
jgi:hypothetical protein